MSTTSIRIPAFLLAGAAAIGVATMISSRTSPRERPLPPPLAAASTAPSADSTSPPNATINNSPAAPAAAKGSSRERPSIAELVAMSDQALAKVGIAEMNLICAQNLPGSEKLNIDACLTTLDKWAARVGEQTAHNFHLYYANPGDYNHSEAQFRILMLGTVIHQDFSARYNPLKRTDLAELTDKQFFDNSKDIFLHGLLEAPHFGTCSSFPVLVAAIGNRLGYPIYLVETKAHVFCRWDGSGETINIEATGSGVNMHADSYYRKWPVPVTDKEIQEEGFLTNLTPRQTLALFLAARASVLSSHDNLPDARLAYAQAHQLEPDRPSYLYFLGNATGNSHISGHYLADKWANAYNCGRESVTWMLHIAPPVVEETGAVLARDSARSQAFTQIWLKGYQKGQQKAIEDVRSSGFQPISLHHIPTLPNQVPEFHPLHRDLQP